MRKIIPILFCFGLLLSGCGPELGSPDTFQPTQTIPFVETSTAYLPVVLRADRAVGLTHLRADGNRVVDGAGRLPVGDPLDVVLAGTPMWIVATSSVVADEGVASTVWAVALDDGRVQAFTVVDGVASEIAITPNQLPIGAPPLLRVDDGVPRIVVAEDSSSALTHPVLLPESGALVMVQADGDVVVLRDGQRYGLQVDALPDARIVVNERESLLLLSNPTDRYGHGVLGDRIEAGGITLIETVPLPRVVRTIAIAAPDVIEGIAPIWADLDGDGEREIIVTLSNADVGAWIAVYNEAGELLATGPSIGQGSRWRHQLAVAPFGTMGEVELVDVLTPHIGGTVEFYAFNGDVLEIVARQAGYTSHVIGTRNLDMAVAGDFDGDGHVELLLPNQARTELGAIRRTGDGAEVAWSLLVDGRVVTNLAAVSTADDDVLVGVGRDDGVLRIWGQ